MDKKVVHFDKEEFLTYRNNASNDRREDFVKDCLFDLGDFYKTNLHIVDFDVHKSDRLVVAHIRRVGNQKVLGLGIYEFKENEVFNEWVGKCMALKEALDKGSTKNINHPQPEILDYDMEVQFFGEDGTLEKQGVVDGIFSDDHPIVLGDGYKNYTNDGHPVAYPTKYKIVDDTSILSKDDMGMCGFKKKEDGYVYIGSGYAKLVLQKVLGEPILSIFEPMLDSEK